MDISNRRDNMPNYKRSDTISLHVIKYHPHLKSWLNTVMDNIRKSKKPEAKALQLHTSDKSMGKYTQSLALKLLK